MTSEIDFANATHPFLDGAPKRMLIGGQWVAAASGKTFETRNPATGELLAVVPEGDREDIDRAVAAARAAFEGPWRRMKPDERAALMHALADVLDAHYDELAWLDTLDMGSPIRHTRGSRRHLVGLMRYFAGQATAIHGLTAETSLNGDMFAATLKEPVGVVGAIIPWNASPGMMGLKLAPSLAAGCAVILKPAELAPLCASYYAELWQEAGGPPGSLNVLHGYGADVGAAMAAHDGIDKITFTGSTAVGKSIVQAAAGNLKKVTLELGGKSPFIVFPDADQDLVARTAAAWCFVASGQACVAASRVFVRADIYDSFIEKVRDAALQMRLGDPMDPHTDLGPLVSAQQKARVSDHIRSGMEEGARMLCGDEPVPDIGHYVRPTVFADVDPDMRIAREEIFGPVLSLFKFDDEEGLLRVVNDTPFGLSGSVWTHNLERALRVARAIDAGQIGVNVHAPMSPQTPFGGNKQSGWGREFARNGLEEFLKIKAITIKIGDKPSM